MSSSPSDTPLLCVNYLDIFLIMLESNQGDRIPVLLFSKILTFFHNKDNRVWLQLDPIYPLIIIAGQNGIKLIVVKHFVQCCITRPSSAFELKFTSKRPFFLPFHQASNFITKRDALQIHCTRAFPFTQIPTHLRDRKRIKILLGTYVQ